MTHTAYNHATYVFDVRCRPGDSGEPEIRHVILADHAGNQALRQLFEALASDSCRYPVTTALEIRGAVLYMLLDHGMPAKEIHAALDQAETYRQHDAEFLPPALLEIYDRLREAAGCPADRFICPLETGAAFGWPGPLICVGRLPHSSEHYLAIDPADPGVVVVRRDPAWAGGRPHIAFSAADPNLAGRVSRLIEESSKDHPDRDGWGDDLEKWAIEARRRAGIAPWGEEVTGQAIGAVTCFDGSQQASGAPTGYRACWEDSRKTWAEEVARRAPVCPEWEEEAGEEEPAARAQAAKDLPPALLEAYNATANGPSALPCDRWTYQDGSEFGITGAVIHEVSGAHRCEFFISLDPDNPDNLVVTRVPAWTLYSSVKIAFADSDLPRQVLRLLDDRDPDSGEWLGHLGSDADDDDDDV